MAETHKDERKTNDNDYFTLLLVTCYSNFLKSEIVIYYVDETFTYAGVEARKIQKVFESH